MQLKRILAIAGMLATTIGLGSGATPAARASGTPLASQPVKLSVTQEGIYKLTESYLAGSVDFTGVDPGQLGLFDNNVQVPMVVSASTNDFSGSGANYIEFYGHPVNNTYNTTNVYVLRMRRPGDSWTPLHITPTTAGAATSPQTWGSMTNIDLHRKYHQTYFPAIEDDASGNPPNSIPAGMMRYSTSTAWPADGDATWFDGYAPSPATSSFPSTWTYSFTASGLPAASSAPAGACSVSVDMFGLNPQAQGGGTSSYGATVTVNSNGYAQPSGATGSSAYTYSWNSSPTYDSFGFQPAAYTATGTFPCSSLIDNSSSSTANTVNVTGVLQGGQAAQTLYIHTVHVTYPGNLCASPTGTGSVIWNSATSGNYAVGGFSSAPDVWRIIRNNDGSESVVDYTGLASYAGTSPCTGGSSYQFGDSPSGQARYLATNAPLTSVAGITPLDQTDLLGASTSTSQYLIIAGHQFIPSTSSCVSATPDLNCVAALHSGQGLTTRIVDVNSIYDQYSGGLVNPDGIRAYIQSMVSTRGTQFVLLAGGATDDSHNYSNCPASCASWDNPNNLQLVPTPYVDSEFIGSVPSDHQYTVAIGDTSDKPDVALGRLPAFSSANLTTEINKILNWKADSQAEGTTAIFAASAENSGPAVSPPCPTTTSSNEFNSASDATAALLPSTFTPGKYYQYGNAACQDQATASNFYAAFNNGPQIVNYIGHGAALNWSQTDQAFLQTNNATTNPVSGLTNSNKPAMVFQFGCQVSYFSKQGRDIDTELMNAQDSSGNATGAALTVGSTGLDDATAQTILAAGWDGAPVTSPRGVRYLYGYLVQYRYSVGRALEEAEKDYMTAYPYSPTDSTHVDVVNSYTILGDPALTPNLGAPTIAHLTALSAKRHGAVIRVKWHVASTTSVIGFNILVNTHSHPLNTAMIAAQPGRTAYKATVRTQATSLILQMVQADGTKVERRIAVAGQ